MTIQHVYNLYDATIETYVAQFFATHDKLMRRECENLYEQAKSIHQQNPISAQGALYRYADSYQMIHTADFDDQKGIYTMLKVPEVVCNFVSIQQRDLNPDDMKIHAENILNQSNNN